MCNGPLLAKYPPDCNKYVDCRSLARPIMSCPPDLQFDEANQYCDYEMNVHYMEMTQTLIQLVQNAVNYYCGESTTVTNPPSTITTTEEWHTSTTTDSNHDCSTNTDDL
ncbi:unnamed protein product [Gordionus sp. m RMFG-2023]